MGLIRQLALGIVALCSLAAAAQDAVPVQQVEVVASFPHDPEAFTQGLVFADGFLFEGTGRNGQSSLRRVDLPSGEIL
ncbi:MAG: glutaminyl-peptide cyclotransferase, partial [Pseudohongiellaceae bacterium]